MINNTFTNKKKLAIHFFQVSVSILLLAICFLLIPGSSTVYGGNAKHIIFFLADGLEENHMLATNSYTGTTPLYQQVGGTPGPLNWNQHWISTFENTGSYDSNLAWTVFDYVNNSPTDSACTATSLFSGSKTSPRRINVSPNTVNTFVTIAEKAKARGSSTGAISSVPLSHATPGGWYAHNDDRANTYAITDEGLFGDSNATGTFATDWKYNGGHYDPADPVHQWLSTDVLIGAGAFGTEDVSSQQKCTLRGTCNQGLLEHVFVERTFGVDGSDALMVAADNASTTKLVGLYDQVWYNAPHTSGHFEIPNLSESTSAALKVLNRNINGFVLMIEGGAIDWAAHGNNMNQLIGEQRDFDIAVQTVIDWVNDPTNGSDWDNTLVIVTGDHSCGYLTAEPGVFPNQPLGEISPYTIGLEDINANTGGRRASWEDDLIINGEIDPGETVYWSWNSGGHTNMLVPLYARGTGAELFGICAANPSDQACPPGWNSENGGGATSDTVRGLYFDNTDVFRAMEEASAVICSATGEIAIIPGQTLYGSSIDLTLITATTGTTNINYSLYDPISCNLQVDAPIINKDDNWRYDYADSAIFNPLDNTWMNTGYDDTAWPSGNGVFGTETAASCSDPQYIDQTSCEANGNTWNPADDYGFIYRTPISNTNASMFFRKTFTVCDPAAVTSLKINALYDDGFVVYINGTQVYIENVVGNPPPWDGGTNPFGEGDLYRIKDLTSIIGLPALKSLLVPGNNLIAVGVYNDLPSSDIVWDGELLISHNETRPLLFSGNDILAQSVSTTGWTDGVKSLDVSGDDALCLEPLPTASDTFTYSSASVISNSLLISNNTPIALTNPVEGDPGVMMQRFQVDSNNLGADPDDRVELSLITLVDDGSATSIADAKIYISVTSSATLPGDAVLIGSTGAWDGSLTIMTLNGGTSSDRTVVNGTPKYIYIVYNISLGQDGKTIKSHVSSVSVAAPDIGAANVGASNLLSIDTCVETGSITITPGQTLYNGDIDLISIVTVTDTNENSLIYSVTEQSTVCTIDEEGTFIHDENFSATVPGTGDITFSVGTSQLNYLGTSYLASSTGTDNLLPPLVNERKDYELFFPQAGTYNVWTRGLAGVEMNILPNSCNYPQYLDQTSCVANEGTWGDIKFYDWSGESVYIGLNGNYTGALGGRFSELMVSDTVFGAFPTVNEDVYDPNFAYGWKYYTVTTSAEDTELDVALFVSSGEADLYVSDTPFTNLDWSRGADCVPWMERDGLRSVDDHNICILPNNGVTTWHIAVLGLNNENVSYELFALSTWGWSNTVKDLTPFQSINTINIPSPGTYTVNVWAREHNYLLDGIYLSQGFETPSDVSHGLELNPSTCNLEIFTGNKTAAQSVDTVSWTPGVKNLIVTGNGTVCNDLLPPALDTFTYDPNHPPTSIITDPIDPSYCSDPQYLNQVDCESNLETWNPVPALLTDSDPEPYIITGTATDDILVNIVEISTDGGTNWNLATCTGCPGKPVNWTYSWSAPNGSYNIITKATDENGLSEIPGPGINVSIQRGGPVVTSTVPLNDATYVVPDSTVTINWDKNIDCNTVTPSSVTISPVPTSWVKTDCTGSQAVFTPGGHADTQVYSVTVSTAVTDSVGNAMLAQHQFSYTTGETTDPSSTITDPLDGAKINSSAPNPYSIDGSASDNDSVTGVEVSTNGGVNWNPATCTGCPGSNVTWTYNWDVELAGDGTYTIQSRATDLSNNVETPGAGNTVTVNRTAPSVKFTSPADGASGIQLNKNVRIRWNENVDCSTVNITNITSTNPVWNLDTELGCNDGVPDEGEFITGGQAEFTTYTVTVTAAVENSSDVPMSEDYEFTYTTNKSPSLSIIDPDGNNDVVNAGEVYNVEYTFYDPDDDLLANFYYDPDNIVNGNEVIISGCQYAIEGTTEGTQVSCLWDTTGMNTPGQPAKTFYIYGIANDGIGVPASVHSSGQITIYPPNEPPVLSISDPDVSNDTVVVGDTYNIIYTLTDVNVEDEVTATFYSDDTLDYTGTSIISGCIEGTGAICAWNTLGMTPGTYYIYGETNDGSGSVTTYAPGQVTINAVNIEPTLVINEPTGNDDAISPGSPFTIQFNLSDPDEVANVDFYFDNDLLPFNPPGLTTITECQNVPETSTSCEWTNTSGLATGVYYIYGIPGDRDGDAFGEAVYSGQIVVDTQIPTSTINDPLDGALIDSNTVGPYFISGDAADDASVQSVEVSTNGGTDWDFASCTGCGTPNASWTFSWDPADGVYNVMSRATDFVNNPETAGPSITVTVHRNGPVVTSTTPADTDTGINPDSTVTINFDENVDCTTVTAGSVTINPPLNNPPTTDWIRTSCSGTQAVFSPVGQSDNTSYTVTVSSTVTDTIPNPMAGDYVFSYTTNFVPQLSIAAPDGTEGPMSQGNTYDIVYSLYDEDHEVTAAFYLDTDNDDTNGIGTPIAAPCDAAPETETVCAFDTSGIAPGQYYIYGVTSDGSAGGSGSNHTWTGEGSDNFASNPANWDLNEVPQDGDDVVFIDAAYPNDTKDCLWDTLVGNVSLASLTMNAGYTGTVTVNSSLTINGDMIINDGIVIQNESITINNGSGGGGGTTEVNAYSGLFSVGIAGITVEPTADLSTTESGGTDTFSIKLDTQPTGNVTIGLDTYDSTESSVSPENIIFAPDNWDLAQTVTVTGVDDDVEDGDVDYTILVDTAVSADLQYNGINPQDVIAVNIDNDLAAVIITETLGNTIVTENGAQDTYDVVLSTQPTADVVVTVTSTDVVDGVTVDKTNLTFTNLDWNQVQTVTVTAVNDVKIEGNHSTVINHNIDTVNTTDASYDALVGTLASITANITDDDNSTVSIAATSDGSEPATNGQFTVTLSAESTTSTIVSYTVGGTAASGTDYTALSGSLTIPANTIAGTIDVTVIDDSSLEGTETVDVTLTDTDNVNITVASAPNDSATVNIADDETATVSIALTTHGAEPAANGQLTVSLSAVSDNATDVTYTVAGTAASGADFTALSGTVTIPAGLLTATIDLTVLDDPLLEGTETVGLTLTGTDNTNITVSGAPNDSATVNITDDETATVSITATTHGAEPATNGQFTVSLSAVSDNATDVTYTVAGTAASGADFTALSGTVTIPAGLLTATIDLTVLDDPLLEGTDTVDVTLTGTNMPNISAAGVDSVNITDNENATVSIASTTNGSEGLTNGQFTVTLTSASEIATDVLYTVTGTAANVTDFNTLSGTVTVSAGLLTATIDVTVTDDPVLEGTETVDVTLDSTDNANITVAGSPASINITDNDSAAITVENVSATEGSGMLFTVTLDNAVQGGFDVDVTFTDGTATGGIFDYSDAPQVLSFTGNASETKQFNVTTYDDVLLEDDETFTVNLSASNALVDDTDTAVGTINDNEDSTVSIASTTQAAEPATNGKFTVTLGSFIETPATVTFSVGGTATEGTDYSSVGTTVFFSPFQTEAMIDVTTIDDFILEGTETVIVTLESTDNTNISVAGSPNNSATVDITDDDSAAITVDNVSAVEGIGLLFTVTLDNAVQDGFNVDVTFADVTAGGGVDYTSTLQNQVFTGTPAETKQFTVVTNDDSIIESAETFTVNLSASSALVTDSDTGTGTITDNDNDAVVSIAKTTDAAEPATNGQFTVSLTKESATATLVTYSVVGTAADGVDYTTIGSTVNIPAGSFSETIDVVLLSDTIVEETETVVVTVLSTDNPANISVAGSPDNTATVDIVDDDQATASISVTTHAAEPATNGQFTVSLTEQSTTDTVVNFTVTGTATADTDYTSLGTSVTVPANQTSATIDVTLLSDLVLEGTETVEVTLTGTDKPGVVLVSSTPAIVNITDDETAALTVEDVAALEGVGLQFTVTLDNAVQGAFTVDVTFTNGTAAGGDYTGTSQQLNFAGTPGEGQQFTVSTTIDALIEADETFTVNLFSSNTLIDDSDTATGTITNDDTETVSIDTAATIHAAEPATNGRFTVKLNGGISDSATIVYYTVTGSAVPDSDYTELSGSVTIGPYQPTALINVNVIDDAEYEDPETVIVTLDSTNKTSVTISVPTSDTVNITSDDLQN